MEDERKWGAQSVYSTIKRSSVLPPLLEAFFRESFGGEWKVFFLGNFDGNTSRFFKIPGKFLRWKRSYWRLACAKRLVWSNLFYSIHPSLNQQQLSLLVLGRETSSEPPRCSYFCIFSRVVWIHFSCQRSHRIVSNVCVIFTQKHCKSSLLDLASLCCVHKAGNHQNRPSSTWVPRLNVFVLKLATTVQCLKWLSIVRCCLMTSLSVTSLVSLLWNEQQLQLSVSMRHSVVTWAQLCSQTHNHRMIFPSGC